jgi:hypothetical protein
MTPGDALQIRQRRKAYVQTRGDFIYYFLARIIAVSNYPAFLHQAVIDSKIHFSVSALDLHQRVFAILLDFRWWFVIRSVWGSK